MVELALDDQQLAQTNEKDWWFEEDFEEGPKTFASQGPCRWCVSVGSSRPRRRNSLNLACSHLCARAEHLPRHWPLDLIDLNSLIARPRLSKSPLSSASAPSSSGHPRTLRLLLHLSNPPNDKLLLANTIDACKTQYINQVKEADFVRWRNTSKVTNLRRADLEAGWDGIMQGELPGSDPEGLQY